MSKDSETELSTWLSTYGLLTAEQVLKQFNIHLSQQQLAKSFHEPNNFYHQLLRVPLKHVFNGIVLQQANDYRIYAQKLFIDYLVSDACGNDPEGTSSNIKDELERQRLILVEMSSAFDQLTYENDKLIAQSQALILNLISQQTDETAPKVDTNEIIEALKPFGLRADEMRTNLRDSRRQFYDLILTIHDLFNNLSDYYPNRELQAENLDAISFDVNIGG